VSPKLYDRRELAAFLESLADCVSHSGVYGEHAVNINGSALE